MSKEVRKQVDKIYKKIDLLAKKGKDNVFEYYKYIDELVVKGEYSNFELALYYNYNIDTNDYMDVEQVKRKTWKEILFQTNTSFMDKLKKMYDSKNVYQISSNIYTTSLTSSSVQLGQIYEVDQYSQDAKYLIENKEFAKLMGSRKIFLDVVKNGVTTRIDADNDALSADQNLLNRYTLALNILLA